MLKRTFRKRRTNWCLSQIDLLRLAASIDREYDRKDKAIRPSTVVVGQPRRTGSNYTGVFV